MKRTKEASEKSGLLLDTRTTKIIVTDKNQNFNDLLVEDERIEEVEEFTYQVEIIIDTKYSNTKEMKEEWAWPSQLCYVGVNMSPCRGRSREDYYI